MYIEKKYYDRVKNILHGRKVHTIFTCLVDRQLALENLLDIISIVSNGQYGNNYGGRTSHSKSSDDIFTSDRFDFPTSVSHHKTVQTSGGSNPSLVVPGDEEFIGPSDDISSHGSNQLRQPHDKENDHTKKYESVDMMSPTVNVKGRIMNETFQFSSSLSWHRLKSFPSQRKLCELIQRLKISLKKEISKDLMEMLKADTYGDVSFIFESESVHDNGISSNSTSLDIDNGVAFIDML